MKYYIFMFICMFNFISCEKYNKIYINWIDIYNIESVDFLKYPIKLLFYNDEINDEMTLFLNPNTDNFIKVKNGYNLSGWESTSNPPFKIEVYPNIDYWFNGDNTEIFLSKNVEPNKKNELINHLNERVLAYLYYYEEDDNIYTVISKNTIINLDKSNLRYLGKQIYTIEELLLLCQENTIYFKNEKDNYKINLLADLFPNDNFARFNNYSAYIVKSNINGEYILLDD